jgi:hypothetical protein
MKSGMSITKDNTRKLVADMLRLTDYDVLVGIPADKAQRKDGDPMSNAELGYVHENGSPAANIPARPFLAPGIVAAKGKIENYFRQAGEAVLASDPARMLRAFSAAGQAAASAAQMHIRQGIPPPLAASTVAARRRRSKGSKYRRKATSASDTTPLIDTAQMLRSITYVVRRGKGRFR